MKPRLALVGIGRTVELVDLVATHPFQKKMVLRHFKKCGRRSAECLWVETEDWENIDTLASPTLERDGVSP